MTEKIKTSENGNSNNNNITTVFSPKSVAEILEVKESFIKRQLREGNLKGFKLGKFWRIPKAALDEYCQSCTGNGNGNGNGKVAEETRNKIQFHAALRSQDAIPGSLEATEANIEEIKARLAVEQGFKKIAYMAKLRTAVKAREEKKQRLNSMADDLNVRVEKAYPGLSVLIDQDPDALEEYFAQGGEVEKDEEPAAKEGHLAKRLMVAGKV